VALGLFLVVLVPAAAFPQTPGGLDYRPSLDVPLTVAGATGALLPQLFTDKEATWTCRWCDRDDQGRDTLNGLDAAVRRHWCWTNREKADVWSDATLTLSVVGSVGTFVAVRGGFEDGFGEEALLLVEAAALSQGLNQGIKFLFRRQRPWAHAQDPPGDEEMRSRDSVLSFASGHAATAFTLAVTSGSLASLRGDEGKEWVWATGLTFATATAYLRVAADRHYLTDVLAGAAVGAAVGWTVPRLVDRRPKAPASPNELAKPRPLVPAFTVALGPGRVVLGGGLQPGGAFVSVRF
jgi:membrane-associated phospholipid phosphatase